MHCNSRPPDAAPVGLGFDYKAHNQSMWAEREQQKSLSALKPISVTPAPRSDPAPRSAPASSFSTTPAHRSGPLQPILGLFCSIFRSAHSPLTCSAHNAPIYSNVRGLITHPWHVPNFSTIRQSAAKLLTTEQIFSAHFSGGNFVRASSQGCVDRTVGLQNLVWT